MRRVWKEEEKGCNCSSFVQSCLQTATWKRALGGDGEGCTR